VRPPDEDRLVSVPLIVIGLDPAEPSLVQRRIPSTCRRRESAAASTACR
jgi:hypothetical protein